MSSPPVARGSQAAVSRNLGDIEKKTVQYCTVLLNQAQHPDIQTPSAETSEESHLPVTVKETIPGASASIAAFISSTTSG